MAHSFKKQSLKRERVTILEARTECDRLYDRENIYVEKAIDWTPKWD